MASTGTKDSTSNQPANLSEETKKTLKARNLFYEALDCASKPIEQILEIAHQMADMNDRICKEMRRVIQDSYRVQKLNVDLYRKYLVEKRAHMRIKTKLQKLVASRHDGGHPDEDEQTEDDEEVTSEDRSDEYGDTEDEQNLNSEDENDEHCK